MGQWLGRTWGLTASMLICRNNTIGRLKSLTIRQQQVRPKYQNYWIENRRVASLNPPLLPQLQHSQPCC
jgi:hypothetical protein